MTRNHLRKIGIALALGASLLSVNSYADNRMDVRIERGRADYEAGNYLSAVDQWASAVIYGTQRGESVMYPAAFLCGMWYTGTGFAKDLDRAIEACSLVKGKKGKFELNLFQGILEKNGAANSTFAHKKAYADAAAALRWYIDTQM